MGEEEVTHGGAAGDGGSCHPPPPTTTHASGPIQTNMDSLRTFIWNPKAREFLGRTKISWAKIGLFYVIFYAFLALFFSLMMAVFYQTLDTERRPKLTGGPSNLRNVGLGFRPTTDLNEATLHITYSPSQPATSQSYVDSIDGLLQGYSISNSPENAVYRNCSFDMYDPGEEPLRKNETCYFDVEALGSSCSRDDRWGYDTHSPCVFLKVNKVIDWEPQTIRNLSLLPAGLQQHILASSNQTEETLSRHIWVWCESEEAELEQASPGVPYYYFPYLNQRGYLSPIIPLRVLNLKAGDATATVQCRAWAHNIHHRLKNRPLGEVSLVFSTQSDAKTEL